jgi:hypothetical protein
MQDEPLSQQSFLVQTWMVEEQTQPLPTLRVLAFRAFLARHKLTMLDVARAAGVRMLTVWNITRDLPVSRQQAEMVRAGLYRLTGTQYRGGITLRPSHAPAAAAPSPFNTPVQ